MIRILSARSFKLIFVLVLGLFLISLSFTPITHAADPDQGDSSSFNVFDILSTKTDPDREECEEGEECLTADLIEEAEAAGTSPIGALILRVIDILTLLIGTFAFVMLIIGGFMFATAQGNETTIDRAKGVINQSLLGVVLAFASYFIVSLVQSLFY